MAILGDFFISFFGKYLVKKADNLWQKFRSFKIFFLKWPKLATQKKKTIAGAK
jgi:hypothetical protein